MAECLFIGIGGFIGSVCRYLIGLIPLSQSNGFPVKTLAMNVAGAFAIGLIAAAYMLLSLILGVAAVFAAEAFMHM